MRYTLSLVVECLKTIVAASVISAMYYSTLRMLGAF